MNTLPTAARFAHVQLAPGFTVDLIPHQEGADLILDIVADTPKGRFTAQGKTTVEAWQAIKKAGRARFSKRLDQWFHGLLRYFGAMPHGAPALSGSMYLQYAIDAYQHPADTAAQLAQGATVGCASCVAGAAVGYSAGLYTGYPNGDWNQPGDWTQWRSYHYYPISFGFPNGPWTVFPQNFWPPQDGYGYPMGLPRLPPNPSQIGNARGYAWAYPPFTSDWLASTSFCPPLGCGL